MKWVLSELEDMTPDDERFDAKFTVMAESVRHHVKEEEGELFPKLRKGFTKRELDELGERLAAAKKTAPTRPHPRLAGRASWQRPRRCGDVAVGHGQERRREGGRARAGRRLAALTH